METDDHEKDNSIEDLWFSVGPEHITQQHRSCLSFRRDQHHVISTNPPLLGSTDPFFVSLRKCLFFFFTTTWRKKGKMGFCTVPDHFVLFVDWLSEWQSKQDASTCVHPRGRGQRVPLTFQSMSITGYRGGREASLVIVLNLRTSHVRWVAIISLIGSKKQRLMGELW